MAQLATTVVQSSGIDDIDLNLTMFNDRVNGMSLSRIAEKHGVSQGRAKKGIAKASRQLTKFRELLNQNGGLLALQEQRLLSLLEAVMPEATGEAPRMMHHKQALSVVNSLTKLYGLEQQQQLPILVDTATLAKLQELERLSVDQLRAQILELERQIQPIAQDVPDFVMDD